MFAAHRRPQFLLVQRTSKVVLFAIMAGFIQLVYAVAPILMPAANAQTTTFGFGNGTPQTLTIRLPANWFANLGATPGTNVGPIIIETPSGTALSLADFFTQ